MPRRKVTAEERKRVAHACDLCRVSKRRCDGRQPCRVCTRRGTIRTCIYSSDSSSASSSANSFPTATIVAAATADTVAVGSAKSSVPASTLSPPVAAVPAVAASAVANTSIARDHARTYEHEQAHLPALRPTAQILLDSRGEKVSLGSISAHSFLRFLKSALRVQLSPAAFVTDYSGRSLLENPDSDCNLPPLDIAVNDAAELIDCFFIGTNGLFDLVTREEVSLLLSEYTTASQSRDTLRAALLNVILAVGAQARVRDSRDRDIAARGINHGRRIAFRHSLENYSIDLTRLFLLMAFYMITACRRPISVMYIGIAATSSIILGLHVTEYYAQVSAAECAVRWRTFRSLRMLDILNASLLGRPCMSSPLTDGIPSCAGIVLDRGPKTSAAELCEMLQRIMRSLHTDGVLEASVAETFTEELLDWGKNWKAEQLTQEQATDHIQWRASLLGDLHVSCIYYHTLILVTRPALIESLSEGLHLPSTPSVSPHVSTPRTNDQTPLWMCDACVDAASHLAKTCSDALARGVLFNDMCLVRTVLFEAGLLLGFVMSVCSTSISNVENAFENVRGVLKAMSPTSILANDHCDTLNKLFDAITIRRQQKTYGSGRPEPRKVERLANFDYAQPQSEPCLEIDPGVNLDELQPFYNELALDFDLTFDWTQSITQINDFLPLCGAQLRP